MSNNTASRSAPVKCPRMTHWRLHGLKRAVCIRVRDIADVECSYSIEIMYSVPDDILAAA